MDLPGQEFPDGNDIQCFSEFYFETPDTGKPDFEIGVQIECSRSLDRERSDLRIGKKPIVPFRARKALYVQSDDFFCL